MRRAEINKGTNLLAGLSATLGLCALFSAQPAFSAAPLVRIEEYQVSDPADHLCNLHPTDHVNAPEKGTDIWFIESRGNRVGRFNIRTGKVDKFDFPKVTPVGYTTHSLNSISRPDSDLGPCDLHIAPDGMLWFNYQAANSLGYMETKPPYRMKLLEMPTPKSLPMAFQMGADGHIYVELTAANKIARIDPRTHKIEEFDVPVPNSGIVGGAASEKDGAHWFILMNSNHLLRFDYATQKMETFAIPSPNAAPFVIRAYDDGLWFTLFGANAIGHFDLATKAFTEIPLPQPKSMPVGIIMGRDGHIYSALIGTDTVVRIDRARRAVVDEYPLPTRKAYPDETKQGPDGAIWIPQNHAGRLARLWLSSFGTDPSTSAEK